VISTREQDARDAALWRAARDLARLHGTVLLLDRMDCAIVAVGGERQTSDGVTLDDAMFRIANRLGLDASPQLPLTRDTILTVPQYDSDEGGL
jgi:hypothetical protein